MIFLYYKIRTIYHSFFFSSTFYTFGTSSSFFCASSSFFFAAYTFFISFNFCKHFWAFENVCADTFFTLKLKSVNDSFVLYFLLLSSITTRSYFAIIYPSYPISYSWGRYVSNSFCTKTKFSCSFFMFSSWVFTCFSFVGSPFCLNISSWRRNASRTGPILARDFFKFW